MAELLRTNDPVHQSVMEGSIGALQMRVLVADEDVADARQALTDGGLEQHLVP